ncbi:PHP domain-containing protein [Vibrio sp.]|uniref:PHP domain-containing protein n=1 Tax=Vibrio sp. TaxID=678 RepID=UPI003D123B29
MKKIDLHIHTVVTPSDPHFDYSLDTLKQYVTDSRINCIAITNHNVFDKDQFLTIKNELTNTVVFPGIEVDLEGGHILVIADVVELDIFNSQCSLVSKDIPDDKSFITFDRFIEIFEDLSKYIIIPHIDKSPSIKKPTLEKLGDFVDCGEVQSVKKFLYALKKGGKFPPVLFSDMRSKKDIDCLPIRQTYTSDH